MRFFTLTLSLLALSLSLSAQQRGAATLAYQHVDLGEPFPSPAGERLVL